MGHQNFEDKYLGEHRKFFGDVVPVTLTSVEKGQVVRFNYRGKVRNVFVVAAKWENKLHGMDLAGIPRSLFLPIANADPNLTPEQLYDKKIKAVSRVLELHAYRTYDRFKIGNVRTVIYDSTLQPTEKGEGLEDPGQFAVTDQKF